MSVDRHSLWAGWVLFRFRRQAGEMESKEAVFGPACLERKSSLSGGNNSLKATDSFRKRKVLGLTLETEESSFLKSVNERDLLQYRKEAQIL